MSRSLAVALLALSTVFLAGVNTAAAAEEGTCPCPLEKKLTIGGVSHGNTADSFWDPIYEAAGDGAEHSNVELKFDRYDSSSTNVQGGQELIDWMVERIEKYCSGDSPVNGLFSTINNPAVLTALQSNCKGIPTIIINAGESLANEAGFDHFIGTNDYDTGKDSGEKMLSACPGCERFYCIDHCGGCESWVARCEGFEAAVGDGYGQRIEIDDSSEDAYIASIESVIGVNSTWDNVGLLLGSQSNLVPLAKALGDKHKGITFAGVDTSPKLYEMLADDDSGWLWGTSQQPYLQGYLPVQLLANKVRMGMQGLTTFELHTGPTFVTEAPKGAQLCQDDPFENCAGDSSKPSTPVATSSDTVGDNDPSPGARKLASTTTRLVSAALRLFGI